MTKIGAIGVSLIISFLAYECNDSSNEAPNKSNIIFAQIGEAVKDKKVVALGESSHGIGEFFEQKSELVKYLHQHHDFEVLAFESGLGDLNLAWSNIDSLSGAELLDKTLFDNFKCAEILGLFDYIKEQSNTTSPLIYSGFDNQMSSSYFIDAISPVLSEYAPQMISTLEDDLNGYVRWFRAGYYEDEKTYKTEAESFVATARSIQEVFYSNKEQIGEQFNWTDFKFEMVEMTTKAFERTVDLPFEERQRGSAHRDAIMFDNFKWLLEEIYPDKKIIIWAHNGHIERKNIYEYSYKWMGHYLAEYLDDDFYSIGLFAKRGEAYRQWGDTIIVFDNDTLGMIESTMDLGDASAAFVDLRSSDFDWQLDTLSALEMENGGLIDLVPAERFDGIWVLDEVGAPTFFGGG